MMGAKQTGAAILTIISLPVLLVLVEGAHYHVVNRSNGRLVLSGVEREYELYVPPTYNSARPTPLVISLHGGAMWPAAQRDTSRWNAVADREGIIVVYPSGAAGRGPRAWHAATRGATTGDLADVRFIAQLIDHLARSYNIDRARIYANGLSNGAGMSFALSCTMPDRIAAVGLVGAAYLQPWGACADPRAVPMIAFHGTDDAFTPYHGGKTFVAAWAFPDQLAWTANWAERNGCRPTPSDVDIAADVSRRTYSGCANDAAVVFYTIKGGGHTWPGGGALPEWLVGRINRSVDATQLMWEFFRDHPLQQPFVERQRQ